MLLCTYEMISFLLSERVELTHVRLHRFINIDLASALIFRSSISFPIDPCHWAICRQTVCRPKPSAMQIMHKLFNFLENRSSSFHICKHIFFCTSVTDSCVLRTERKFLCFSLEMPPWFLTVADLRNVCIRGFWFQFYCFSFCFFFGTCFLFLRSARPICSVV